MLTEAQKEFPIAVRPAKPEEYAADPRVDQANVATADAIAACETVNVVARLGAIVNAKLSTDEKFERLHRLADAYYAVAAAPFAPCHRGCTHCCHIPCGVTQTEAYYIGRKIGIKPHKVGKGRGGAVGQSIPYGYDHPCPFLEGGACSIYAHRPLSCRSHYSLARTPEPCELQPEQRYEPFHKAGDLPFVEAQLFVGAKVGNLVLADIRDFFPHGLRRGASTGEPA